MAKGFQRLTGEGKSKGAPKEMSPTTTLIHEVLDVMRQSHPCEAADQVIRKGLAQGLLKPQHFEQLHGPREDWKAWSELSTRQSSLQSYAGPSIETFLLQGWQIASWTGQANDKTDPAFLHAARQACLDISHVSIDRKRAPTISSVPASDGMVNLALPFDVYMVRFECKSQMSDKIPGQRLEEIDADLEKIEYENSSYVQRTSPHVVLEWTHASNYDDNHAKFSCHGVAFFCADPAKLDAFIDRRPPLKFRAELFEQASRGSSSVIEALDNGFPVDLGSTWLPAVKRLLHNACSLSHDHLVKALLARGACANRLPHEATAPVHTLFNMIARSNEQRSHACLKALVEHGLDLQGNICKQEGVPPLHQAATQDWVGCAALLMSLGADPLAEDENGKTPLSIAQNRGGASDCAALFEAHLAKSCIRQIISGVSPKP